MQARRFGYVCSRAASRVLDSVVAVRPCGSRRSVEELACYVRSNSGLRLYSFILLIFQESQRVVSRGAGRANRSHFGNSRHTNNEQNPRRRAVYREETPDCSVSCSSTTYNRGSPNSERITSMLCARHSNPRTASSLKTRRTTSWKEGSTLQLLWVPLVQILFSNALSPPDASNIERLPLPLQLYTGSRLLDESVDAVDESRGRDFGIQGSPSNFGVNSPARSSSKRKGGAVVPSSRRVSESAQALAKVRFTFSIPCDFTRPMFYCTQTTCVFVLRLSRGLALVTGITG